MTLPSKPAQPDGVPEQSNLERKVIDSLERANGCLSDEVVSDIARARMNAVAAAKRQGGRTNLNQLIKRRLSVISDWLCSQASVGKITLAAPMAVAVIVTVLVSYNHSNPIPAIPAEIFSGEVPTEELAMLEELEFASWLAEQQQEGLL